MPALVGASLEVLPAEVMALVGQNGAGKSTMIKILNGAYVRDAGSISFDGKALDGGLAAGGAACRNQHDLPGDQPDRLPLCDREHFSRSRAQTRLWPARLGEDECRVCRPCWRASTCVSTCASRLSGFQHRRPADGGDCARGVVQRQARHHGRAHSLARRARGGRAAPHHPPAQGEGVAVIFVSHKLDELYAVCDRVTIMRDGRTVAVAAHGRHHQAAARRQHAGP